MNTDFRSQLHEARQASRDTTAGTSVLGTSRFAAFEDRFCKVLANSPPVTSNELAEFREHLRDLGNLSTLSQVTLSGRSLRNEALERLANSISDMACPDDQIAAVDDLLAESDKLPHDQNAHVIAKVIQDLLLRGRSGLDHAACPRVGRRFLQAAIKVAPHLLAESVEADSLGIWLNRLVDTTIFDFPSETHRILAEAGLADPTTEAAQVLRRNVVKRIGAELDSIVKRGRPSELDMVLCRIIPHKEIMRARLLAMVVNSARARLCQRDNLRFLNEVLTMLDELPPQLRLPSLEACCNQLQILPNPLARILLAPIWRAVERLADLQDFRYNRTRRELTACLQRQRDLLMQDGFEPGESLADYERRTVPTADSEAA
jgi:hypothetical protein